MNLTLETTSTNKLELSQILLDINIPEICLKTVFDVALQKLKDLLNADIESSLEDRIWKLISQKKLPLLTETLITACCEHVLAEFEDKEINQMLEEFKTMGIVKNLLLSLQLVEAYKLKREILISSVAERANSLSEDLIPEILIVLNKESIPFIFSQKQRQLLSPRLIEEHSNR